MQYTVKVNHRRFLDEKQANSLSAFGIKVVLNNHVYGEYSSHMPTELELNDEQLEQITSTFSPEIFDNVITINLIGAK